MGARLIIYQSSSHFFEIYASFSRRWGGGISAPHALGLQTPVGFLSLSLSRIIFSLNQLHHLSFKPASSSFLYTSFIIFPLNQSYLNSLQTPPNEARGGRLSPRRSPPGAPYAVERDNTNRVFTKVARLTQTPSKPSAWGAPTDLKSNFYRLVILVSSSFY